MAHGSGGESTSKLISDVFAKHFKNEFLDKLEDSAVVPGNGRIAVTTDSFVVTPILFPGGDIGRLSICGTVNDLLMSGARPMYLTCGCILEEGLDIDVLDRIIASFAETCREAGVTVVTGDTKVIENKGGEPGLIINTSGVGFIPDDLDLYAAPLDNLAACYMKRNEYAKAVPLLERALLLYRIQEFNDSDFAYQRCNALKKMVECQKELCNKTLAILYEHELRLLEDGLGKK